MGNGAWASVEAHRSEVEMLAKHAHIDGREGSVPEDASNVSSTSKGARGFIGGVCGVTSRESE